MKQLGGSRWQRIDRYPSLCTPSTVKDEYLTVEDAMLQVLDMISAAGTYESELDAARKIAWRLTDAHTNSPPLTVTAQAYSKDPEISVHLEAERALSHLDEDMQNLMDEKPPWWLTPAVEKPLDRILTRNLNGISQTRVQIDGEHAFIINSRKAQRVANWIKNYKERLDSLERSEIDTVEGKIIGLTRHYNASALVICERLSGEKTFCVLSNELAKKIGSKRLWIEVWQDQIHQFSGDLYFDKDGALKRIVACHIDKEDWSDVPLEQLRNVRVVDNRTIQEHLDEFWGEKVG